VTNSQSTDIAKRKVGNRKTDNRTARRRKKYPRDKQRQPEEIKKNRSGQKNDRYKQICRRQIEGKKSETAI
jgi:hypothetical protein